jgi:hypothetical protein
MKKITLSMSLLIGLFILLLTQSCKKEIEKVEPDKVALDGDQMASTGSCSKWTREGKLELTVTEAKLGNPYRWVTGKFLGEYSYGSSPDCDYVFEFTLNHIDRLDYIRAEGTIGGSLVAFGGATYVVYRRIGFKPNTDCGTYKLQVLIGKGRLNYAYGDGKKAKLVVGVTRVPKTGWCYVGKWGTEKWWLGGVYAPQYDNWGRIAPGAEGLYSKCTCKTSQNNWFR